MAQSAPLLIRLVASSVIAANRAGRIVHEVMSKGDLGIVDKGTNDLQTEADRAAQHCIVASLAKQFPGITIIGEEDQKTCDVPADWLTTESDDQILKLTCPEEYQTVNESDIVVWVDPLDGTAEYTQGLLDHVTVLIGIAIKDKPVGGVIHQPYFNYKTKSVGRTMWGIIGVGVGGFTPKPPPEGKLIVTTTRSHANPIVEAALKSLKPDEIIRVGGAGHKVLLLMEGRAHAYVFASRGCKRWDTCAPEAVLTAMGGKLTDLHGTHYSYAKDTPRENTAGVLASAKLEDHEVYLKTIPSEIRQSL